MTVSRILIVRRDNIGDLVCTIPLILALRARHPSAYIAALVNSYNAAVLENHPALDALYSYTKLKHRGNESALRVYADRMRLLWQLRRRRFDIAYVAGPASQNVMRTVRLIRPSHIIRNAGNSSVRRGEDAIAPLAEGTHEVVRTLALLGPPVPSDAQKPVIFPDLALVQALKGGVADSLQPNRPIVAVHISARKPSQRWPIENFTRLIAALTSRQYNVIVLWSPGKEDDARHPGDDNKAQALQTACTGPLAFVPTPHLKQLIAALALCQIVICSDGGAMHLAAALDKPIVCLFGKSDAKRWHPYGVPYRLLQHDTLDVNDITVAEVLGALDDLMKTRPASDDRSILV